MKKLALLFCLFFIAAATGTGEHDIQASYDEDVLYVADSIQPDYLGYPLQTTFSTRSATTISQTYFAFVFADYTYALTASDIRGNQAIHQLRIEAEGDVGMELSLPGANGMGAQSQFEVVVRTDVAASCEWTFSVPGINPSYRNMETPDGRSHTIDDFERTYRFKENEGVPVIVRCNGNGGGEQTTVYTVGWTEEATVQTSTLWPAIVTVQGQTVEITTTSTLPTKCQIYDDNDAAVAETGIAKQHTITDLSSTPQYYVVACEDASGTELPSKSLPSIKIMHSKQFKHASTGQPQQSHTPILYSQ